MNRRFADFEKVHDVRYSRETKFFFDSKKTRAGKDKQIKKVLFEETHVYECWLKTTKS